MLTQTRSLGAAASVAAVILACDRQPASGNAAAAPSGVRIEASDATSSGPTPSPPVLVVTAVDYEYAAAVHALSARREGLVDGRQASEGQLGQQHVVVVRAGWGKAQASAAAATAIRQYSPFVVVMAGVGGGLDVANVTSGDVIIVKSTFQYDLGKMTKTDIEIWPPETPLEQPYPYNDFLAARALVGAAWRAAKAAEFRPWGLPRSCACEKDGTRKPSCSGADEQVGRDTPRVCVGTVGAGDAFVVDVSDARPRKSRNTCSTCAAPRRS